LNIEIGRHNTIKSTCISYNLNDNEHDFHFVSVNPDYINLRNAYNPKYYSKMSSVFKFIELIQTKDLDIRKDGSMVNLTNMFISQL